MPKRIKPTKRQLSLLGLHAVAFTIGVVIMWTTYDKGHKGWTYPWPAWITAAWGLWLMGHFCVLFTSYVDKGLNDYKAQDNAA
ncbi:MAG TPA: hypothetical protein VN721_03880 [Flavipsychrobacter sp.]|nr:hypothetical protein [Flavipsychrobacter sp.]